MDLGRSLALEFAREQLTDSYDDVRDIFRKAGAYRRFKGLLQARGQLDAWHAYEASGIEQALRAWAEENDIELIGDINAPC